MYDHYFCILHDFMITPPKSLEKSLNVALNALCTSAEASLLFIFYDVIPMLMSTKVKIKCIFTDSLVLLLDVL